MMAEKVRNVHVYGIALAADGRFTFLQMDKHGDGIMLREVGLSNCATNEMCWTTP